jgi:hypothetical protein
VVGSCPTSIREAPGLCPGQILGECAGGQSGDRAPLDHRPSDRHTTGTKHFSSLHCISAGCDDVAPALDPASRSFRKRFFLFGKNRSWWGRDRAPRSDGRWAALPTVPRHRSPRRREGGRPREGRTGRDYSLSNGQGWASATPSRFGAIAAAMLTPPTEPNFRSGLRPLRTPVCIRPHKGRSIPGGAAASVTCVT